MIQFLESEQTRTVVASQTHADDLGVLEARCATDALDTVSQRAICDRSSTASTLTPGSSTDNVSPGPVRVTRFMGAPMAVVTEGDAVRAIVDAAVTGSGHWTITANLDHIRRYHRDPAQRALIDDADMVVADGTPLIWASRLAGEPLPERVSGSSMVWSICEAASASGQSIFLLGGDPGVAERAADVFRNAYPGLEIAGTGCPPVGFENNDQELDRIKREVTDAAPRIVFVALGFPKQDLLIRALCGSLPSASFLGVGISLSYATGDLSRPPAWICNLGLEWAYRLRQEPTRRLVRRYIVDGLPFAMQLTIAAARHRVARGSHGAFGDGGGT
jgi:N-acetylglucosaminyldiphosphoundecaprenol N-acetyl-beta-D-mannosaminyltransferase